MRRVFIEFAKNIYEGDLSDEKNGNSAITILYYDRLNKIICEEIVKVSPSKPALVSWLKDEDKTKAIQELTWLMWMVEPHYPDVHFDYFYKMYGSKSPEIIYEMTASDLEFSLCLNKKRTSESLSISKHRK